MRPKAGSRLAFYLRLYTVAELIHSRQLTVQDLAVEWGCSPQNVYRYLNENVEGWKANSEPTRVPLRPDLAGMSH